MTEETLEKIHEEMISLFPVQDWQAHNFACAMNYLIYGNHLKAYEQLVQSLSKLERTQTEFQKSVLSILSVGLIHSGNTVQAMRILKYAIQKYPDEIIYYNNLAVVYTRLNDRASAIHTIVEAETRGLSNDILARNSRKIRVAR